MDMLQRKSLNKLVSDSTKNNLNGNTVKQKYYLLQLLTYLEPIHSKKYPHSGGHYIKILYRETQVSDDINIIEAVF